MPATLGTAEGWGSRFSCALTFDMSGRSRLAGVGPLDGRPRRPGHLEEVCGTTQCQQRLGKSYQSDCCAEPVPRGPTRQLCGKTFVRDARFGKAGVGAPK